MSQIPEAFAQLKLRGRTALAPYFMAGFPDLETSFDLIETAIRCGADLIELGMPFSDPLADGPTIQKAGQIALQNPFTLEELLNRLAACKGRFKAPMVLMTYYNLILQLGLEKTARKSKEAGLSGFIVPDLPLEEMGRFREACQGHEMDIVPLIAPTSSPERIRQMDKIATGMLYYVSRTGITGAQTSLPADLVKSLDEFKALVKHPAVVGFGISNPEHAQLLHGHVDGIVIASAIIDRLLKSEKSGYQSLLIDFLEPISQKLG